MQSLCKFKMRSAVTQQDLSSILTPDECVRLFSRARHINDAISAIPSALLAKLPVSAKKDIFSLQSALRPILVRADWVGLANSARRPPMSNTQLQSFPALQALIHELQNQAPSQIRKAGYQAVTDDVAVARNVAHSPIASSPEHKIVVEFAGQWPPNAACLALGRSGSDKERITNAKPDAANSHRSLATFKDLKSEPRSLYIKIPCQGQPTPIMLRLAEDIEPVATETQQDEWDNVLIPIVPVVPTGDEYQLVGSGYFYIIWNNKVWRELEITPDYHFADVNLDYYRNNEAAATAAKEYHHINIDGCTLVPDSYVGGEPIQIVKDGQILFSSELPLDQKLRVTQLEHDEVEVSFPQLDIAPFVLPTQLSTQVAVQGEPREAQGAPLPHIWIPYRVKGELQTECYFHYSKTPLTLSQLQALESDPANEATTLSDLQCYSNSQSFVDAGDSVDVLTSVGGAMSGCSLINEQAESNIAAVKFPLSGPVPTIRYLTEVGVDLSDDFFELRNTDEEWSDRVYLGSCVKDKQGYVSLEFAFPPQEVAEVDIVRGAHCDISTGSQRITVLRKNVPIKELLG